MSVDPLPTLKSSRIGAVTVNTKHWRACANLPNEGANFSCRGERQSPQQGTYFHMEVNDEQ